MLKSIYEKRTQEDFDQALDFVVVASMAPIAPE